jgi:hypothetical protein
MITNGPYTCLHKPIQLYQQYNYILTKIIKSNPNLGLWFHSLHNLKISYEKDQKLMNKKHTRKK